MSVPVKNARGWDVLMRQRRDYWSKADHDKLSPHFKASEFWCNDGSPCPTLSRNAMVRLCAEFLEPLREKFGTCLILSGYRHAAWNAQVGGVKNSQHVYEMTFESVAADTRFEHGSPYLWAQEAKVLRLANRGGKGGIGTYARQGFLHVDNRNYGADWSL